MIATKDRVLAEHEAASQGRPRVLLRKVGWQSGFGNLPGRMLFNVVGGDYIAGSTVTIESMLRAGLRVEVVE